MYFLNANGTVSVPGNQGLALKKRKIRFLSKLLPRGLDEREFVAKS